MSVIKNYGLRWVRDQVAWRSSLGIEKGLFGKRVGGKRSEAVNFADQIGVYVLYEPV